MSKPKKSKKRPPAADLEVVQTRSVADLLARTEGLLRLIQNICEATEEDACEYYPVEKVFTPYFVKSLGTMCYLAVGDIDQLKIYLSKDGPDYHNWQLDDLVPVKTSGGAS